MRVTEGPKPPNRNAVTHSYRPGQSLEKLDEMLGKGEIQSYYQEGDRITVVTNAGTNAEELDKALQQPASLPFLKKASEVFIPPDMDENCAPEYLRFRLWQLGGAVCGGALGFLNAQINLNALNKSFSSTESAALAGTIISTTSTFSSMGASFLAKKGDADPKRSYLNSTILATANTLGMLGGLYFFPNLYMPFSLGSTLVGAVAGGLGGSAGVNIANHMAKEQARGIVGAKNGNQDRVAGFLGVPLALAVTRAVKYSTGWNPTLASMGILGAALFVCNLQSATALRFESVDRSQLETLARQLLQGNKPDVVAKEGYLEAIVNLFKHHADQPGQLRYLDNAGPLLQSERIRTLANEDYLVGLDDQGKSQLIFRKNLGADALIRGVAHGLNLQRCSALKSEAEKVLPGKGELLLTELAYRSLPRDSGWKDQLSHNGWHVHAEKLALGTEQHWKGVGAAGAPIAPADLEALLAKPSADRLRELLKDSPLLAA